MLIEVADTLVSIINAPAWIPQVLVYSAALGLPLALVLAWIYEWTSEGIKATGDVAAIEAGKLTGRKIDFAIIGLLVVAIGFLLVGRVGAIEPSIAVLPFSNESAAEQENIEFANGIHNETLTQLGKISSLTVIGRSSVMEYRDSPKSVREIGRELGVATLLQGQVQRAGGMVRINVQLIDVENDQQLWGGSYNRTLTAENIFGIQSAMATAIADELNAALIPEEVARLNEIPTQNEQARLHYQSGIDYANRDDEPISLPLAVEQFERAVSLDPEFALAWAELARVHSQIHNLGHDPSDQRIELIRTAVETAQDLAPDLPEVHLALAAYYASTEDREQFLAEIEIASQGMPNNPVLYQYRALRYRRMGRWNEAIEAGQRASDLDPRNNFGPDWMHLELRNYSQYQEWLDEYLRVFPDLAHGARAQLSLFRDGDVTLTKAAAANPEVAFGAERMRMGWIAALYEFNYEEALEYANDMEELYTGDRRYIPKESYIGVTHQIFGRPDMAAPHFEIVRDQIEEALEANDQDARLYVTLGEALVGLGEIAEAVRLAHHAIQLLPRSRDTIAGSRIQVDAIVRVLAPAGDVAAVIEELDDYLSYPSEGWSLEGLLPDPRFNMIEDNPDFQAFVESRRR